MNLGHDTKQTVEQEADDVILHGTLTVFIALLDTQNHRAQDQQSAEDLAQSDRFVQPNDAENGRQQHTAQHHKHGIQRQIDVIQGSDTAVRQCNNHHCANTRQDHGEGSKGNLKSIQRKHIKEDHTLRTQGKGEGCDGALGIAVAVELGHQELAGKQQIRQQNQQVIGHIFLPLMLSAAPLTKPWGNFTLPY